MTYGIPRPANHPQKSQPKRRKLNRATGSNKKRMKNLIHGHGGRWKRYTDKFLAKMQQQRLNKKNERRAEHGLAPLTSYSQV